MKKRGRRNTFPSCYYIYKALTTFSTCSSVSLLFFSGKCVFSLEGPTGRQEEVEDDSNSMGIAWSQPILPSFHVTSPSPLSPYLSLAFMLWRRALCTPTITGFSFLLPFPLVGIETQLVRLPLFSSPISLLLKGAWRRKTEKLQRREVEMAGRPTVVHVHDRWYNPVRATL